MSNALAVIDKQKKWLDTPGAKQAIQKQLPQHIKAEQMVRATLLAMNKNPAIAECSKPSIWQSVLDASSLGLDCSGLLGSGYLVPYGKTCTFIPGYRGLIDLARRSGEVKSIHAVLVRAGDHFEEVQGTGPSRGIVHKRSTEPDMSDNAIIAAYAVAVLHDGTEEWEVMYRSEIDAIKNKAKAKFGPWVDHFGEMARKTVIRRLIKTLPLSVEKAQMLAKAVDMDDSRMYDGAQIADSPSEPLPDAAGESESRADALADELAGDEPIDTTATVVDDDSALTACVEAWSKVRGLAVEDAAKCVAAWLKNTHNIAAENATPEQLADLLDKIGTKGAIKWSLHEKIIAESIPV